MIYSSIRIHSLFLVIGILICFNYSTCNAQADDFSDDVVKLLNVLDLNKPELASVKANSAHPEKAAKELLKYYKNRTSIKYTATHLFKEELVEQDLKYANDAIKHIFVGQPAYKPYFCGEDINWSSSPVPDNEWVWQLNRMYFWNSMAKVYAKTGDEKYPEEWSKQIIHWVKNNPRDANHKYAWRSIEAGIRGRSWTDLFFQFVKSPHFNEKTLVYLLNGFYAHAEFLNTVYTSKSNWALMEAEGMAYIAIAFPEFKDALKWRTEAIRRFNKEISLQVNPDGHQRELAIGYHVGCIQWFYRTYEFAKLNNLENAFPQSFLEMIELMCEVPMKIGFPDGTNVQFGDAWQGEPYQYADRYLKWSEIFKRNDFKFMATKGKEGIAPDQTKFAFPESGIYSMRSAWNEDAVFFALKCGSDGGGHCQPDNGTFVLYAGGRNLMPDAGSYIYHGDPEGRSWFRQTKVHQTLTLNSENTSYAPKLLKWESTGNTDILVVENNSYQNLTHRRSVYFVDKRYFVIVDDAIGTATGDVDIHFQLAPGEASFNHEDFSVHTSFSAGANVFVQTLKQKGIVLSEEEGWVSFEYTKKEPRTAFRYRIKKEKNEQQLRFVTLVAPYEKEIPTINLKLLDKNNMGITYLEIEENNNKKIIEIN